MKKTLPDFTKVTALVIGDVMLDVYEHGIVSRISPEAPVPVFRRQQKSFVAGGAANVALNLAKLGCRVELFGATAQDVAGKHLRRLMGEAGVKARLGYGKTQFTTVKTRFVVDDKHLLRMDEDSRVVWSDSSVKVISKDFERLISYADIVVLSDYDKGFLSAAVCQRVIDIARHQGRPVMVDPKGHDYTKYRGASIVKPNLNEFEVMTGARVDFSAVGWETRLADVARTFCRHYNFGAMLITLGAKGMSYVPRKGKGAGTLFPSEVMSVYDVSGAGDTALAVLSAVVGAGGDVLDACDLANRVAGLAVAKRGTAVVSAAELEISLCRRGQGKVVDVNTCVRLVASFKKLGKTVGFTNGCFDCCHLGHLSSLQEAKRRCDILIVGVNSDNWIRRHKGRRRPIQDEATRTAILAALESVDFVVVFSSETALPLVKRIKPQVIAKEGYAFEDWPEGRYVQSIGGKAIALKRVEGYSTTGLISRMGGV